MTGLRFGTVVPDHWQSIVSTVLQKKQITIETFDKDNGVFVLRAVTTDGIRTLSFDPETLKMTGSDSPVLYYAALSLVEDAASLFTDKTRLIRHTHPQKHYKFDPLVKVENSIHTVRLESYFMRREGVDCHLVKISDKRCKSDYKSIVLSSEILFEFCNAHMGYFLGDPKLEKSKGMKSRVLELYYKTTRTKHGREHIHRSILLSVVQGKAVFPAEVQRRFNISYPAVLRIFKEMSSEGIIRLSSKVGRKNMYTIGLDRKRVQNFLSAVYNIAELSEVG
jgi:ribosomal protein S25